MKTENTLFNEKTKESENIYILVVEDERIVALDIKNCLKNLGYPKISIVSNGNEALQMVSSEKPNLVLMDIMLKGELDGVEVAQIIHDKYNIPVIYITAYADETTLQRAKVTEPYGYILKPFEERDLHTSIEMALYKHKMEGALKTNEERYRRFFEEDLTGDFISTAEGELVACNPVFARIFGYDSIDEALKINLQSLFPTKDQWEHFLEELFDRRKLVYYERELRRSDGRTVHIVANILALCNESGELHEIQGYIFDDTDRKNLEKQFLQAQKMEAVGRLAGGIAHDFNNLLTVINGYSEVIITSLDNDVPYKEDIREIKRAGERAAILTKQLLAFSRKQILMPRLVDLNSTVTNMEKLLNRIIGENIKLKTKLGKNLYNVEIDPGQTEQVIMNLSINARDAMQSGGILTLETDNIKIDEESTNQFMDLEPGNYVKLSVSDTGCGMDEETLSHIFEPFFTTKPKGEGTGLGLSTVYGIVTQSRGNIYVESSPESGTSFHIYLPQAEGIIETDLDPGALTKNYRGTETILVVEDESVVRDLITRILARRGYTVLGAGDGEEALTISRNHIGEIHMVISDIIMPGLNGPDLVKRIKIFRPETKTLYMSGYTDNSINPYLKEEKHSFFLQKPFKPEELSALVRKILDSEEKATGN